MPVWEAMRLNQPGESIVVVPSVTPDETQDGATVQALEERFLFLLFLLRQPRLQVIYVTGRPVPESIVEYYLGLLPGVIPRQARAPPAHGRDARRLARVRSPRSCSRGRGCWREIRALIPDPARSHLVPYSTSSLERDVALMLGIPLYGADPTCCRSARRPAAGGCSPRRTCSIHWAARTCTTSTGWSTRCARCGRPSRPSRARS